MSFRCCAVCLVGKANVVLSQAAGSGGYPSRVNLILLDKRLDLFAKISTGLQAKGMCFYEMIFTSRQEKKKK
jgi:hypothetical protein